MMPAASHSDRSRALADWREQLWSTYVRLESRSDVPDFYGDVACIVQGAPQLSIVSSTAQITERNAAHVRSDASDYILLALQKTGHGFVEQDDRRAKTQPGEFVLYETCRPYRLSFDQPFEQIVFRIPRAIIDPRVRGLSKLTARPFDGNRSAGVLVAGFLQQLTAHGSDFAIADLPAIEYAGAELVATALNIMAEAETPAETVFRRIETALASGISDAGFSFDTFARQQGMSRRSLQRVFQSQGVTPRGWLRERRLRGVAASLASQSSDKRSVTEIALAWGFNDLSYFNRAFRDMFAMSPGRWRQVATADRRAH